MRESTTFGLEEKRFTPIDCQGYTISINPRKVYPLHSPQYHLEEGVADSGVSLQGYGHRQVDGAGQSDVDEGQQDRQQLLVQARQVNTRGQIIIIIIKNDNNF